MQDIPTMIDVDEALRLVLSCVSPGPVEDVPLADALNRTLAAPVTTDLDDPPFNRSVMDGYAVRSSDVRDAPVRLSVAGEVPAGSVWAGTLNPGETIGINTGAPIPAGADAVVRVEHTESDPGNGTVLVKTAVPPGHFITERGAHVSAGDNVLNKGGRLTPGAIGVAAAAGVSSVRIYCQPRVALISTGNELVEPGATPKAGQIRNSNQVMLAALSASAGAEPSVCGVALDNVDELKSRIEMGLECDVLCLTGGVSMGTADLVPDALAQCGVETRFRKMAIKPGRPVLFGTGPTGTPVFALPGNPVSAFVGFELLVRPALARRCGDLEYATPWMMAQCIGPLKATTNRRTFIPAIARVNESRGWQVEPTPWRGSGDVFGLACANALIMRPPDEPAVDRNEQVLVTLLEGGGAPYSP